jgi:prepilin-type N-terminal cleavage/methylation domain-containing protein
MTGSSRASGFTLLELVLCVALMGVMSYAAWDSYTSGLKQTAASSESLSAGQNALILMESMQEDVRQMSILNMQKKTPPEPLFASLVPYSMYFSTNGKSFMLRKSTLADTSGEMSGSSFSVVIYRLMRRPGLPPGVYTVKRVERSTDGNPIVSTGRENDETLFRSVFVRDIQFDLVVRLEGMVAYQTFVRVSINAVNTGDAQRDDRTYFISNLFNVTAPEFVYNRPDTGEVGFARRFPFSLRFSPTQEVVPGRGFYGELPPPAFPEFREFKDYIDGDGTERDIAIPQTASVAEPFAGDASGPAKRSFFCNSARDYVKSLVGEQFKGRVIGQIVARTTSPTQTPAWVEPYSFDATKFTSQAVAIQIDRALGRMIPHGEEAVQDLGHTLRARASSASTFLITTPEAQAIVGGQ